MSRPQAPGDTDSTAGSIPAQLVVDDYDVGGFAAVAAVFDRERLGYVVTPNVDQIIRYVEDPCFRAAYADAAYVLLDSRFLARCLMLARGQKLRVCPGSDLTAYLLARASGSGERIVLVGGTTQQAAQVAGRYQLDNLVHLDPPMGFIRDPVQVERCLNQIEAASPFRYCFVAVGSPQQELVAWQLQQRQKARGLVLCIGASINFLTGVERRAPRWMQQLGAEWLYRLVHSPSRMAQRYLIRGPRIFLLLFRLRIVAARSSAAVGIGST